MVIAPDQRRSTPRIRSYLVSGWKPENRRTNGLAVNDEQGRPGNPARPDRIRLARAFLRRQFVFARYLPHGESQPRAWQQRRVVLCVSVVWFHSRTAFRRLRRRISIRSTWL